MILKDTDCHRFIKLEVGVGRSSRQAYAYFFHTLLKGDALLRMDALSEANNIGSGFILSNRDLEIRGAGNILGKSQSGAINSVGYAMYTQMLEDDRSKVTGWEV
jgi:transcription-repair coupling factor (superfamily II helicase)